MLPGLCLLASASLAESLTWPAIRLDKSPRPIELGPCRGAVKRHMHEMHDVPHCALCGRPVPPDVPQSLHHLVPRLKGGGRGPVVLLHHICHKEIHATLSEAELARDFATPEALRAHPRLARFIAWVQRRPPGFNGRTKGGRRRR